MFKKMKKRNKKNALYNEIISIWILSVCIVISLGLAILIYFLVTLKYMKVELSLTALFAITGAIPTVYLWIVKERKKEKDQELALENLKKKDAELYQNKISELNKVYVDAINQFYDNRTFMAGAYALFALVEDWLNLSKIHTDNAKEHLIRVSQISSILFSKHNEVSENMLYCNLIENLFITTAKLTSKKDFKYSWEGFSFNSLNLKKAKLPGAKLVSIDLMKTNLSGSNLRKTNLRLADLREAKLTAAKLIEADLIQAKLAGAQLNAANLKDADLRNANLDQAKLTGANLKGAKLVGANLMGTDFNRARFEKTTISMKSIYKVKNITLKQLKGCIFYYKGRKLEQFEEIKIIDQLMVHISDENISIPNEILQKIFLDTKI